MFGPLVSTVRSAFVFFDSAHLHFVIATPNFHAFFQFEAMIFSKPPKLRKRHSAKKYPNLFRGGGTKMPGVFFSMIFWVPLVPYDLDGSFLSGSGLKNILLYRWLCQKNRANF